MKKLKFKRLLFNIGIINTQTKISHHMILTHKPLQGKVFQVMVQLHHQMAILTLKQSDNPTILKA